MKHIELPAARRQFVDDVAVRLVKHDDEASLLAGAGDALRAQIATDHWL